MIFFERGKLAMLTILQEEKIRFAIFYNPPTRDFFSVHLFAELPHCTQMSQISKIILVQI